MNKIVNGVANDFEFDISPISAYGSINIDELNQVMERLKKIPNYDELIKDNNKKDKEIERLNNIINELKQKNNLAENILYDYLYNDNKITKEKYEQFKGLKEDKIQEVYLSEDDNKAIAKQSENLIVDYKGNILDYYDEKEGK